MVNKIILRSGRDDKRLTIVPKLGEVIFTVDTHQTFVGDGKTLGGVPIVTSTTVVESIVELDTVAPEYLIVYVENTSSWYSRTKDRPTFKPMKLPPTTIGKGGLSHLYLK